MASDLLSERVVQPISTSELERRWKAVRGVMKDRVVDFLLIQNSNDYLGGYVKWFTDLPAVNSYPMSVIFPLEGKMTTISHGSSDPAKSGPPDWLLRGVGKRISTPVMMSLNYTAHYDGEKVVEELKKYKNCRIALVQEGAMTAGFSRYVREHLSGATVVDITDEIDEIKAVKSPEEIDRIKVSARIHDEAMKACFEAIKPGAREHEVVASGLAMCKRLGSEQGFIIIGSAQPGEPFPYNHAHAVNRVLREGDQVGILIEVNDAAGYYTHLSRIACIGKIPEELAKLFEDAKEAQKITLNMMKPGADPIEMLRANNEFMKSRGYGEETRIYAHGQGYDLLERPSFQPGETMKLQAGMNIAPHPGVAKPTGNAGICDNYIVNETGVSECLHKTSKEIFLV